VSGAVTAVRKLRPVRALPTSHPPQ
jgi:hypothetical protein